MSRVVKKIRKQLKKARSRHDAGKHADAVVEIESALSSIEEAGGPQAVGAQFCLAAGEQFVRTCESGGRRDRVDRWATTLFRWGMRTGLVGRLRVRQVIEGALVLDLDALETLTAYVENNPDPEEKVVKVCLGRLTKASRQVYARRSQVDESWRDRFLPLLQRLHHAIPALSFVNFFLGRHLHDIGEYGRALRHFALVPPPLAGTPKVLNLVGRCHEKAGDLGLALSVYRRSLGVSEAQEAIHFRIGRILLLEHKRLWRPATAPTVHSQRSTEA